MAYQGTSGKAFLETELVQTHIVLAKQFVADDAGRRFGQAVTGALIYMPTLQFDSPLEVLFWFWWDAVLWHDRYGGDVFDLRPQQEVVVNGELFRVDFLVEPNEDRISGHPAWTPIAVEVDGHAFHERTPEQVALRDRRDRELQKAKWTVFHYSFREFTQDPVTCVTEVVAFARQQWNRVSMSEVLSRPMDARRSISPSETRSLGKGESVD